MGIRQGNPIRGYNIRSIIPLIRVCVKRQDINSGAEIRMRLPANSIS